MKRDLSYLRELLVQFEDGVWKPEVNGIGKGSFHFNLAMDAGLLTSGRRVLS